MIPYMRANLGRKRRGLAAADAIVAVSTTIASDLRARAPEIRDTRLEIIPNPVDIAALRRRRPGVGATDAGAIRALHRQARTKQGHEPPRPGH